MRRKWTALLVALLAAAGTAIAGAGDRTGRYELSPFIGGYVFDSMGYENNLVLGAHGGKWFTDAFSAELSLDFVPTHTHTGTEQAWLGQLHADALYHFRLGDTWAPYLVAGLGFGVYNSGNEDLDEGWDLLLNYGAGVKYFIDDTWAARLDLRQPVLHEEDSTHHNFMYTAGVSYFFGGPAAPAAPAAVKAEPPPPPPQVTAQLKANPASIERGSSSALQWSTTGSSQSTIEGIGAVPVSGSTTVAPQQTTTYTLKAQGPGGSAQANATVTVKEPPPPPAPAPIDSDRDGVTDDKDKCPNTPAGTKVDAQGCPLDSDRDGVTDDKDKCPNTPAGTKVDAQGCPLDSDRDGVTDDKDKCPSTPAGTTVDAQGCPLDSDRDGLIDTDETGKYNTDPRNPDTDGEGLNDGDEVLKHKTDPRKADTDGDRLSDADEVLKHKTDPLNVDTDRGSVQDGIEVQVANTNPLDPKDDVKKVKAIDLQILFDSNSDVVKAEYLPKVEEVAKFMKEYSQVTGTIEGHTDNAGGDAYNLDLSKRRAASVAKLLVDRYGVEPARLKSEGYGETKPIASNDTAEGRQKNRRIMAIFEAK